MQELADETGGEPFFETNDFGKAVAGAIENGSSYYTLAYVPKNPAPDEQSHNADDQHRNPAGQYRKIQVRLDPGPDVAHGLKPRLPPRILRRRREQFFPLRQRLHRQLPLQRQFTNLSSVFAAALAPDAPAATAILLRARVLPATDPSFQPGTLAGLPAAPASPARPARRYIVDLTIDAHSLSLDNLPDGSRKAAIELAMIAYDGLGHPLNNYTHAYQVGLSAAQFQRIMSYGISVRLPFDMPAGDIDLRIGVHDLNANRAGSLDIPLSIPTN